METTYAALPARPAAIQSATWRDLVAVRQLEQICFPADSWPLLEIIGVLTMPGVVRLKAVTDEQIVGFAAGDLRRSEDLAWIATIGVLPEYRRRGIGAALLQECEGQLYRTLKGAEARVRLCVRVSNQPAIGLYQRAGYQELSVWSRYYQDGEDALVLEKRLPVES
jgi:ribosomal-protein-alanine N-acetyltransferase